MLIFIKWHDILTFWWGVTVKLSRQLHDGNFSTNGLTSFFNASLIRSHYTPWSHNPTARLRCSVTDNVKWRGYVSRYIKSGFQFIIRLPTKTSVLELGPHFGTNIIKSQTRSMILSPKQITVVDALSHQDYENSGQKQLSLLKKWKFYIASLFRRYHVFCYVSKHSKVFF